MTSIRPATARLPLHPRTTRLQHRLNLHLTTRHPRPYSPPTTTPISLSRAGAAVASTFRWTPSRYFMTTPNISNGAHHSDTVAGEDKFDGWETIIGLEIHAQLETSRKLFSESRTSYEEEPNSNVLPFDAAFPGTLPVLNRHAVHLTLATATALNCSINRRSTFDRKHYFYHDIPASYQITQHYNPIATNGTLRLGKEFDGTLDRDLDIRIQQIQIEQDTAKTTKLLDGEVFVDLNRAGMGLMEIVTEADMRSPKEAGAFIRKLQGILRRIGASDGDMEKGSMRVDANVSIHRVGTPFGTRCEIKNLNSVRYMMAALDHERHRQLSHYLTHPSTPLKQETRGFDEVSGETYSLRSKEEAEDYRYMPDGNLGPVVVGRAYLEGLKDVLPELPDESRRRLPEAHGITLADVEVLLSMDDVHGMGITYFEDVLRHAIAPSTSNPTNPSPAEAESAGEANPPTKGAGKKVVNWIVNELLGRLAQREQVWTRERMPVEVLGGLIGMVNGGKITGTSAKNLLKHLLDLPSIPVDLSLESTALSLGLIFPAPSSSSTSSSNPDDQIKSFCQSAIAKLPDVAESVRKGKEKVVMRLVGEVMKESKGTVDARRVREVLLVILRGEGGQS